MVMINTNVASEDDYREYDYLEGKLSEQDNEPERKRKVLSQEQVDALLGPAYEVYSPNHYSRWKIEPLDFIMANDLDFLRGNIIKYIMRYDAKNGVEDLKKARVYLDKLIEKVERENGK